MCASCARAAVKRRRALNDAVDEGKKMQKFLNDLRIACPDGHVQRYVGTAVDDAAHPVRDAPVFVFGAVPSLCEIHARAHACHIACADLQGS